MLTITTTKPPATDLGYLLHKHPDKIQTFDLPFGKAHVFYPEASEERCTAALMLEIDSIRLTRRGQPSDNTPESLLQEYVNDRPYCASSHLSVAIAKVFGTALSGRNREYPELAASPIPLQATVTSIKTRNASRTIPGLFEPLGYQVETETPLLNPKFPEWGEGYHNNISLTSETNTLAQLLVHLYVLLPVLDTQKHYWISEDETEKLLRFGKGWLENHPMQGFITARYLGFRPHLYSKAQQQLALTAAEEAEGQPEEEEEPATDLTFDLDQNQDAPTVTVAEAPTDRSGQPRRTTEADLENRLEPTEKDQLSLAQMRVQAILEQLRRSAASSVLDLGCGEGQLTKILLEENQLTSVTAIDVSQLALVKAKRRLHSDRMNPKQAERLTLLQGSLLYRDPRLKGADAAIAMEVIEHIDPPKLETFEDAILGAARPKTLIVTTPNEEYNKLFPEFRGPYRHRDHRFEWTRQEFQHWANAAAGRNGYQVAFHPIGNEDPTEGPPTQMAVFTINPA